MLRPLLMIEGTRGKDGFTVPAALRAAAFNLTEAEVAERMRGGQITCQCEQGAGEDDGRWRLRFFFEGRVYRLTVDAEGRILKRARFDDLRRVAADPAL